jgi:hypothetical protein
LVTKSVYGYKQQSTEKLIIAFGGSAWYFQATESYHRAPVMVTSDEKPPDVIAGDILEVVLS